MTNEFVIEAEPRTITGKKVKTLRTQGFTPAIIYGQGEAQPIQVNTLDTYLTLRDADANAILTVKINGEERSVLAREVQRHVTRGDLLHVDFLEVSKDTRIKAEVMILTQGKSAPEAEGLGITSQILSSIEIEAPADKLLSEILVDLSQIMEPDQVITVGDLEVPDEVDILTPMDIAVAKFDYHREEEEEEALDEPILEGGEVALVSDEEEEEEVFEE